MENLYNQIYEYLTEKTKTSIKDGVLPEQSRIMLSFVKTMLLSKESSEEAFNITKQMFKLVEGKDKAIVITTCIIHISQVILAMGYSNIEKRIEAIDGLAELAIMIIKNSNFPLVDSNCVICGRAIKIMDFNEQSVNICDDCKKY